MRSPTFCRAGTLLLLAVAARAQEAPMLRLFLQAGQQQSYRQRTELHLRTTIGGQLVETALVFEVTLDLRVIAAKDGRADVDQTVRRLRLRLQNPRLQVDFDSEQPDAPGGNTPMLGTIAQLLGKTFRMTIDDRGRVSDVKLPSGVDATLGEALGNGDPARFFAQNLPQLPERLPAAGASWDSRTALALGQGGITEVRVQNHVQRVAGSKVEIVHALRPEPARLDLPRGTTLSVQKAAGLSVLDLATGIVVASEFELQLRLQGEQGGFAMDSQVSVVQSRHVLEAEAKAGPAPAEGGGGG